MSSMSEDLAALLGGPAVYARTYSQLALALQQLGQWEDSADITPAILLQAINYALIEGYDIVVAKWADYYTLDTTLALVSGTSSYALADITDPNGFYKLRHLDYTQDITVTANSRFRRMLPHDLDSAHRFSGRSASSNRPPRYRIQGRNLIFESTPTGGTVRMYYIPTPPQFASTSDTRFVVFDVPTEERLVLHIAMRDLLIRSDLSTESVDRTIAMLGAGLRTAADSRDAGEPFYLDPRGPSSDDSDEDFWCG